MPRSGLNPSQNAKNLVKNIGSMKTEDSDASIKGQLRAIQLKLVQLEKKIKDIDDKIHFVQKITRDRKGREIILVKKR